MGLDRRTHDSLDRQRNFCPRSNHLVIRLRLAPEARSLEVIDLPYSEGFDDSGWKLVRRWSDNKKTESQDT